MKVTWMFTYVGGDDNCIVIDKLDENSRIIWEKPLKDCTDSEVIECLIYMKYHYI